MTRPSLQYTILTIILGLKAKNGNLRPETSFWYFAENSKSFLEEEAMLQTVGHLMKLRWLLSKILL